MIRGSDGLDYEDLTEKLLGNPAKTRRNDWLIYHRQQGRSRAFIEAWEDGWEVGEDLSPSDAQALGVAMRLTEGYLQPGGEVFEDIQRRLNEHAPGTILKTVSWHTYPGVTVDTHASKQGSGSHYLRPDVAGTIIAPLPTSSP